MTEPCQKIAIIGSVGIPANYGGFETLAEQLALHLQKKHEVTVYCSSKAYPEKNDHFQSIKLQYIPLKANGIQSIPYDLWSICKAIRNHETLIILGVASGAFLWFFRLFFRKKKMIVHVDGREWKREKWNALAKRFLKFSEAAAIRRADAVVADNQAIKEDLDARFGINSQLIAYGADHVQREVQSTEILKQYPVLTQDYAFSVCRIEPENNIHLILEAFSEQVIPLVLVGNWDVSPYSRDLKTRYSQFEHINLIHPIYDQHSLNQMRSNCRLYVHGHSAGGTNPSLVEAMWLGLNIVAFDVNFNRFTTQNEAVYFASNEELSARLAIAEEIQNGVRMEEIARANYSWVIIGQLYENLLR